MAECIVTGCRDCPFLGWNNGWDQNECLHPLMEDIQTEYCLIKNPDETPDWCELNKEPITITKKGKQ